MSLKKLTPERLLSVVTDAGYKAVEFVPKSPLADGEGSWVGNLRHECPSTPNGWAESPGPARPPAGVNPREHRGSPAFKHPELGLFQRQSPWIG